MLIWTSLWLLHFHFWSRPRHLCFHDFSITKDPYSHWKMKYLLPISCNRYPIWSIFSNNKVTCTKLLLFKVLSNWILLLSDGQMCCLLSSIATLDLLITSCLRGVGCIIPGKVIVLHCLKPSYRVTIAYTVATCLSHKIANCQFTVSVAAFSAHHQLLFITVDRD